MILQNPSDLKEIQENLGDLFELQDPSILDVLKGKKEYYFLRHYKNTCTFKNWNESNGYQVFLRNYKKIFTFHHRLLNLTLTYSNLNYGNTYTFVPLWKIMKCPPIVENVEQNIRIQKSVLVRNTYAHVPRHIGYVLRIVLFMLFC